MGGIYFLIFKPKDMLNQCLNLNETQPIYAYKHYGYKNNVPIHSSQMQTIFIVKYTLLAYFAAGQNANIFVSEILTNLLHRTFNVYTFRKEIFLREKMKKLREENFYDYLSKLH